MVQGKSNAEHNRGARDQFIAVLPWDDRRRVVVHRREFRGQTYVRFRVWNHHRTRGTWYPTDRAFIAPMRNAGGLADALRAAALGEPIDEQPRWLEAFEAVERGRAQGGSLRRRRARANAEARKGEVAGLVDGIDRLLDRLTAGEPSRGGSHTEAMSMADIADTDGFEGLARDVQKQIIGQVRAPALDDDVPDEDRCLAESRAAELEERLKPAPRRSEGRLAGR